MHEHGSLPRARQDGLLEETVGEELLLYDQDSHTAHCLSPLAVCVWRHCDGEHDLAELAVLAGVSERVVADALHELRKNDLLAAEPKLTESAVPGVSRREAIVRVARYGAAATAGSMIVSATAATPAMAGSATALCTTSASGKKCCVCEHPETHSELCVEGAENEPKCKEFCEKEKLTYKDFKLNFEC